VSESNDQWCWCDDGNDYRAYGPYNSRDEAITAATWDSDAEVVHVAKIVWIRPEDYVRDDLDTHLEYMEELAFDNSGMDPDGDFFFEAHDKAAAQAALSGALKSWARVYLSYNFWRMADETKKVTLVRDNGE